MTITASIEASHTVVGTRNTFVGKVIPIVSTLAAQGLGAFANLQSAHGIGAAFGVDNLRIVAFITPGARGIAILVTAEAVGILTALVICKGASILYFALVG